MNELGTRLKKARIAKGYSLDDVEKTIKLQKRYLNSIEEGNFSTIPGPFHVRAFIKLYADALGLDSDELLETHKQEIPSFANEERKIPIPSSPFSRKSLIYLPNSSKDIVPMVIVASFIILVILILWFLYQNLARNTASAESSYQVTFFSELPTKI